ISDLSAGGLSRSLATSSARARPRTERRGSGWPGKARAWSRISFWASATECMLTHYSGGRLAWWIVAARRRRRLGRCPAAGARGGLVTFLIYEGAKSFYTEAVISVLVPHPGGPADEGSLRPSWLHADRAAGSNRHHCRPHRPAAAGRP